MEQTIPNKTTPETNNKKKITLFIKDDAIEINEGFISDDGHNDESFTKENKKHLSSDQAEEILDSIIHKTKPKPKKKKKPQEHVKIEVSVKDPPIDPNRIKIFEMEQMLYEFNKPTLSYDLREKVLLLDIDLQTKAHIIGKLDQPVSMFSGDNSKFMAWVNSLVKIPFGEYKTTGVKNPIEYMKNVKDTLDSVTYGNNDAKEQILEYIAKTITNKDSKGAVIALKGEKGTGKTSLIRKGLSKVLDRPFHSINFGGLTDTTILVGHNSTYMGSKYGRLVDILIKSNCMNPIIYLDEIDKISEIGTSGSTEIFGILTHLLDEEQNKEFLDNYFDGVKIDLSRVLFVISFNNIDNIDSIVSDRMKIINIKNPTNEDKLNICKLHIIPEILQENKMLNQIDFTDSIVKYIINNTEKESGVRRLKKNIESIVEKLNMIRVCDNQIDLSYKIPNSFPIILTEKIVDKLIIKKPQCDNNNFMYS